MITFIVSTLVFGLVIAGMAIGVIMGRAPIKGSCGGMGALGIDTACDLCGGNPNRCEEETRTVERAPGSSEQFYSADK
jgi:hypothetical protein